jgi:hypothetical protein
MESNGNQCAELEPEKRKKGTVPVEVAVTGDRINGRDSLVAALGKRLARKCMTVSPSGLSVHFVQDRAGRG